MCICKSEERISTTFEWINLFMTEGLKQLTLKLAEAMIPLTGGKKHVINGWGGTGFCVFVCCCLLLSLFIIALDQHLLFHAYGKGTKSGSLYKILFWGGLWDASICTQILILLICLLIVRDPQKLKNEFKKNCSKRHIIYNASVILVWNNIIIKKSFFWYKKLSFPHL